MKQVMGGTKRWLGFLLSVLLVVEASGIQVLATEHTDSAQQPLAEKVEELVSEGDVTEGDVSEGDVTAGDAVDSAPAETENAIAMDVVASGIYYGMNWSIDSQGVLTISGTYNGAWDNAYVKWSQSNAKDIIGAKITATGVTNLFHWFNGMSNLKVADFSEFDSAKVTDMSGMFEYCEKLTSLDLSDLHTDALENVTDMLDGCTGLTEVYCFKNLTDKTVVALPNTMFDRTCKLYTEMPLGQTESVLLENPIYQGTYCGMDWAIGGNGHLSICGTFTSAESNDAPWLAYADQITTATVTATGVTSTKKWFFTMANLKSVDLSAFDSSNVKNMSYMFYHCSSLTGLDLSKFNTSSATAMRAMFEGCSGLTTLDLSGFDTDQVTNMGAMFNGCKALTALDLTAFDTRATTDMSYLFNDCVVLKELKFTKSTFTTANVTTMNRMFRNCYVLQSLDVSGFDTGKVTDTYAMFYNCNNVPVLDVSGFNTVNVIDMSRMFYCCSEVKELDVSGFETGKVQDMENMFFKCSSISKLDLGNFDMGAVTLANNMLKNCDSLLDINTPKNLTLDVVLPVTMVDDSFREYTALPKNREDSVAIRVSKILANNTYYGMSWNLSEDGHLVVSGMYDEEAEAGCGWHYYADHIKTAKVTAVFVTSTAGWFRGCTGLTEIDLSQFDMRYVADVAGMFTGCNKLIRIETPMNLKCEVTLPVPLYNVWNGTLSDILPMNVASSVLMRPVENVATGVYYGMDWTLDELGHLEIFGVYGKGATTDTSWEKYQTQVKSVKVTAAGVADISQWFAGMYKLQTADLSEFDSSKVTTMNRMFYNCRALSVLNLENCDFSAVTDATEMLYGCNAISYIHTPKNLAIDILLSKELEDKDRKIYTHLPKGLESSIVLSHVIYRIAPIADQVYTGKAIKPEVVVYKGKRILTEGVDYTVSYKNNINTAAKDAKKAPTVTVKGKTNYMGNLTASFSIQSKEITQKNALIAPTVLPKNGTLQKFNSAVFVDGKKLKLNQDYNIVLTDTSEGAYVEPGKYLVDIRGINNYTGTVSASVIILDKEQVKASKLKISKLPTCTYTEGEPAMPAPTVTYGNKELVRDVDYEIVYADNHKAGTASMTIQGLENMAENGVCVVGAVTKTFTIKGTAISKAKVAYEMTNFYNGKEICPAVTLRLGEVTLRQGKDYTVEYSQNVKVGTGTITIKGDGGYTGTMKKTFKIVADPNVADRIKVAFMGRNPKAYYSANGAKPEAVVKLDGTVLEPGKDYTVSYKNNKKISAADVSEKKAPAVVIKGKGNYKFTRTVYFTIVACPLEKMDVTVADKFLGDKKGYLSAPVVKDGTKTLKMGRDYEIVGYTTADGVAFSGKEAVENGTCVTVTVRGIGNYTGEASATYRIATTSMSKVKITAKSLAYNEGKPVIYIGQDIKAGQLVLQDSKTKEILQYGRDYKIVGYTNNTKIGTATVTIVGCGAYGGVRTVKFKIVKYKL